jgi:GH15 family glucan-1,4-alpha-glucosidase
MTNNPSTTENNYPPIADYAFISDCHCTALISSTGSVDWCCMSRIDDDSCFGRLLDWNKGGFCSIAPTEKQFTSTRRYVQGSMILETNFKTPAGEIRLTDFFSMDAVTLEHPRYGHIRIVDGISGEMELHINVCPRFDYGEIVPYMSRDESGAYTATGSNKGLIIQSDIPLEVVDHCDLTATVRVGAGRRIRLMIQFEYPQAIERAIARGLSAADDIDRLLERTREWWQEWAHRIQPPFELDAQTFQSAITLKALTFEPTGAIAAASTTSLPEWIGGERNWDYRYSWIRDSVFAVRALHQLGYTSEANRFHHFIERTSAGSADELQIMYGVDGKRRLTEIELDWLEGYKGSKPVRIGNRAAKQHQLDIYGELVVMAWEWHAAGHPTDPQYWAFLSDVINMVCTAWREKDRGIWEVRGAPRHYLHSKAMCWAAVHRGAMLAQDNRFPAPIDEWLKARDEIRHAIETEGYDAKRGVFVQALGESDLDAAVLLLPRVGFVDYNDPRMIRTADAICRELEVGGLLLRYKSPDGLSHGEGIFLPCTFWLVDCLARQGRIEEAWKYYERAVGCANDIGLFSEEFDVESGQMLGNFPQALTHVSQIMARLTLADVG